METRKKSKIFNFVVCLLCLLTLAIFAAGIGLVLGHTMPPAKAAEIEAGEAPIVEVVEEPTLGSRISEWFNTYTPEFLGGLNISLSGVLIGLITLFVKKKLTKVDANVTATTESQSNVVEVTNTLIEKQNDLEVVIRKFTEVESSRDALQTQLAICQKAILEILTTVYANNSNLPQPIKDLVNLQYVKVLKAEEGAEEKV